MKALYTILFLSLPLFMTIQAQGSWESYNHSRIINKPITSYPYNDGIITIHSSPFNFRRREMPDDKPHFTYLRFIDNEGKMSNLGSTAEFYG